MKSKMIKISARRELKRVGTSAHIWVDGVELDPVESQRIVNHSPDGFEFGYGGSGPSQAALAILLHVLKDNRYRIYLPRKHDDVVRFACQYYQDFKWQTVANMRTKGNPEDEVSMMFDFDDWFQTALELYTRRKEID